MTKTSFALQALAGGAIGAILGTAGIMLMSHKLLAPQDYLPLLLAFMYVVLALTVWINPYVVKTAQPGERLWKRSAATLVNALAIAAPALVPEGMNLPVAYLLIVALYVLNLVMMYRLMKGLDELTRQVYTDTNQVTFNVLLAGLFLYGAAERVGLSVPDVSIWVLNSMVLFFHFIWSQFAWMKRGLGNPLVAEE